MLNFDIILVIDLLALHHAILDCYVKIVTLEILGMFRVILQGLVSWVSTSIIPYILA